MLELDLWKRLSRPRSTASGLSLYINPVGPEGPVEEARQTYKCSQQDIPLKTCYAYDHVSGGFDVFRRERLGLVLP